MRVMHNFVNQTKMQHLVDHLISVHILFWMFVFWNKDVQQIQTNYQAIHFWSIGEVLSHSHWKYSIINFLNDNACSCSWPYFLISIDFLQKHKKLRSWIIFFWNSYHIWKFAREPCHLPTFIYLRLCALSKMDAMLSQLIKPTHPMDK